MSPAPVYEPPFVASILHPTDLSEASLNAFSHALAIALVREARLTLLHAAKSDGSGSEWTQFPQVRATLERWGLLEEGSPRAAVFEKLRVSIEKRNIAGNPLEAILDFTEKESPDLVVLATEGREGLPRWLRPSVAGRVARKSRLMTLFVRPGGSGFVSASDGSTSLQRILVPVDHSPSPLAAMAHAGHSAAAFGDPPVEITVLHVGDEAPRLDPPEVPGCFWHTVIRQGDPAEVIARVAREREADLVVMTTQGRQGIFDALQGSVTERVMRLVECPLLAVPRD